MNLYCRLFGHNYSIGHFEYPWDCECYVPYKEPWCKRCALTKSQIKIGDNNPQHAPIIEGF